MCPSGRLYRPEWVSWRMFTGRWSCPFRSAAAALVALSRAANLLRLDAVSIICSSLARPSGTTAQASHHSRPAPPEANRVYRRSTSSLGDPSSRESQPSMGKTAMELGAVRPPTFFGWNRGLRSS